MMTEPTKYKMFIDDERYPVDDTWVICRNLPQVEETIGVLGSPTHVSFDHDLGLYQPTGYDIAMFLVELDMDYGIMPSDFTYYVHSQNPIGKENIEGLLKSYLEFKENN